MKKAIIKIYFWVGVNVIGIPDLFIHETICKENISRFFGTKRQLIVNQFNELL